MNPTAVTGIMTLDRCVGPSQFSSGVSKHTKLPLRLPSLRTDRVRGFGFLSTRGVVSRLVIYVPALGSRCGPIIPFPSF